MAGVNVKNHVFYVHTASEQDFANWSLLNARLSLHSTVKLLYLVIFLSFFLVIPIRIRVKGGTRGEGWLN